MKRSAQLAKPAAPVLLAALAACATMIDTHTPPPPGWPDLHIIEQVVSGWQVQQHCYRYVSLPVKLMGGFAMACAEWDFASRTCTIYHAHDATPEILDHEYDHCRGYAHPGDDAPARAWAAYQGSR